MSEGGAVAQTAVVEMVFDAVAVQFVDMVTLTTTSPDAPAVNVITLVP
jgi:hypothetical protein